MQIDKQFPRFADLVLMASQEYDVHFNFIHDQDFYGFPLPVDVDVVAVCGSLGIFHLLVEHIERPRRLVLVDVNPVQLAWTEAVVELIKKSADVIDYFKRLYCRDFGSDLADLVKTDPDPGFEIDDAFARVPGLAMLLKRATPDPAQNALSLNYGRPVACLDYRGRTFVADKEVYPVYHSLAAWQNEPPRNGYGFFFKDWGFHSPEGFEKLKNILIESPPEYLDQSIFDVELSGPTFVYLSTVYGMHEEIFISWVRERFEEIASYEYFVRGSSMYIKYGDVAYPEGRLWIQRWTEKFPPMSRENAKGEYEWGTIKGATPVKVPPE